jgi:hypothetical protein
MFMDKVKKFCDHSMILWEMAGDLSTDVLPQPPTPHLLGLRHMSQSGSFSSKLTNVKHIFPWDKETVAAALLGFHISFPRNYLRKYSSFSSVLMKMRHIFTWQGTVAIAWLHWFSTLQQTNLVNIFQKFARKYAGLVCLFDIWDWKVFQTWYITFF